MDLFDSPVKITRDPSGTPVVIIDYGDPLTELPRIDGRQIIEVLSHIRATGPGTVSRQNELHTLTFTAVTIAASIDAAIEAAFDHAGAAPRTTNTYQIETAAGKKWTLAAATMESWSGTITDSLALKTITLQGGTLTVTA
jgi:hypothetical protein